GSGAIVAGTTSTVVNLAKAYVQIDGEWIAYDTFDKNTAGSLLTSGKVAFYRDMTVSNVISLSGSPVSPFGGSVGAGLTLQFFAAAPAPSYGQPGGTGGNATNAGPPPVT